MPNTRVETNAVEMLKADHKKVSALFSDFEKADSDDDKKQIVEEICTELTIHALLEEEIFYPAFQAANEDRDVIQEAIVEHSTIKDLISQIEDEQPDSESYDAKVKVLSEYVKHHVKEEENDMFSEENTASLDLDELGAEMTERKTELLSERD